MYNLLCLRIEDKKIVEKLKFAIKMSENKKALKVTLTD